MRPPALGRRYALAISILVALLATVLAAPAPAATGGAGVPPPPPPAPGSGGAGSTPFTTPGAKAQLSPDGRVAIPPASAPDAVKNAIYAANQITNKPYRYGGGHRRFQDSGYDCSGSVSFALRGGKFLKRPLHSSAFMRWGEPGPGQWITVYTNPGHAYVDDRRAAVRHVGPGRARPALAQERALEPARTRRATPKASSACRRRLEPAERRRGDDHLVAVLEPHARLARAAHARGRAGRDDVARLERHQAREVGDQRRYGEDQVLGAGRLHRLAVQRQRDLDPVVRPGLVRRHERGAARSRAVEDLARHPLRRGELQVARRQVVEQHVAGDVVEGLGLRDLAAAARRSRTRPRPRSPPSRWRTAGSPARHAARARCGTWRRRWGRPEGRSRPRPRARGSSARCRRSSPGPAPAASSWTSSSGTPSPVDLGGEPVDQPSLEQLPHARCAPPGSSTSQASTTRPSRRTPARTPRSER